MQEGEPPQHQITPHPAGGRSSPAEHKVSTIPTKS